MNVLVYALLAYLATAVVSFGVVGVIVGINQICAASEEKPS